MRAKDQRKENVGRNRARSAIAVIRQFYPMIGGTEKQAEQMARTLQKHGWRISIAAARFSRHWPKDEVVGTLPVHRIFSPRIRFVGTLLYLFGLAWYLYRVRPTYDLIQVHHLTYSAFVCGIMGRFLGKPTVCKVGGAGQEGDVHYIQAKWFRFLLFYGLSKIDRVVAVSDEIGRELVEAGFDARKIVAIPNGVDTTYFRPKRRDREGVHEEERSEESGPVITYIGRVAEVKNLSVLLDAAASLSQRFPTLLFLLVGQGPALRGLKEQMRRSGVEAHFRFEPFTNDVRPYLWMSDLFILPSRDEGVSNALLEAMAVGVPPVVSAVGGNPEVVQHGVNGILVEGGTGRAWAETLAQLLDDPTMRRRLGLKARQTVEEQYSMDVVLETHLLLYRDLIGTNQPRQQLEKLAP